MLKVKRVLASTMVISVGVASLALGYVTAQGISAPLPLVIACVAVFSYVALASGRNLLLLTRAPELSLPNAWALGVVVTALALLALNLMLSITAATAFALWAVTIVALDVATTKPLETSPGRADLVGFALCCVFAVVWCKDLASVPAIVVQSGRFPAWSDYFLHAGIISQFGDTRAIGRGGIWLADTPWFVYHYASYTLPAAFAWPLDQPGLPLATSIWAPLGILCLAGATYALGATLAGTAGGIAALAVLFLLPDASNYGLRNGFFSFHWALLAIPTTGYVLGAALLSVVFLHRWVQTGSLLAFALSAALALGTALLRAHVFLLFFPAWIAAVALVLYLRQKSRVPWLVLAGLLAIGAVLTLRFAPAFPVEVSWAFDEGRALERFLEFVHRRQEPTAYQGVYQRILDGYGENVGFLAGVLLVYPACLGIFVILFPLALFLLRRQLHWAGIDSVPLVLLIGYAGVMLLAPIPAHHDATDFPHRPFVLVYALISVWTAALLVRWVSMQGRHGMRLWQTLLVGTALALPFAWTNAGEAVRPKFYWSRPFAESTIAPELVAAADFLRAQARPGDTFAAWPLSTDRVGSDAPTELVALTGVPAYLARPWIHEVFGGLSRRIAASRHLALAELAQTSDPGLAMQRLRDMGVRWYVVTGPVPPAWDPPRNRAAWGRGNVAIYDSSAVRPSK